MVSFILPEWNGKIVGDMHRYGITREMLADASGYSRPYISKMLHSHDVPYTAEVNINAAMEKMIKEIIEDDRRRSGKRS